MRSGRSFRQATFNGRPVTATIMIDVIFRWFSSGELIGSLLRPRYTATEGSLTPIHSAHVFSQNVQPGKTERSRQDH